MAQALRQMIEKSVASTNRSFLVHKRLKPTTGSGHETKRRGPVWLCPRIRRRPTPEKRDFRKVGIGPKSLREAVATADELGFLRRRVMLALPPTVDRHLMNKLRLIEYP